MLDYTPWPYRTANTMLNFLRKTDIHTIPEETVFLVGLGAHNPEIIQQIKFQNPMACEVIGCIGTDVTFVNPHATMLLKLANHCWLTTPLNGEITSVEDGVKTIAHYLEQQTTEDSITDMIDLDIAHKIPRTTEEMIAYLNSYKKTIGV